MRVTVFHQPFDSSGALSHLGAEINLHLASLQFNQVYIFSAFVTSSGTERISAGLAAVVQSGGTVQTVIGINNGLTSAQAVVDLHRAGAEVRGLHTGGSVLYHPKIFLLRGPKTAWLSVGSSNLTGEGLYRNFEANTLLELNLSEKDDLQIVQDVLVWLKHVTETYPNNAFIITPGMVPDLAAKGMLVDEVAKARQARSGRSKKTIGQKKSPGIEIPRIPVPGLSHLAAPKATATTATGTQPAPIPAGALKPSLETRFFAMTLSAHDSSKRSGVKGTPELSLPNGALAFFPPIVKTTRMYPDVYFDVILNSPTKAEIVQYRLWQRPGGGGTGHADLRINIQHKTVDLSTSGGGDIIVFEATARESGPAYEVWLIKLKDPQYQQILARCTHTVTAKGAGDEKRYGFF